MQRFPKAIATLERMRNWLIAKETGKPSGAPELLWNAGSESVISELKLLREALQDGVTFDPQSLTGKRHQNVVDEILQDVEAMFASFAYYYKSGEQHSINSATYLLPLGLPGAVILDATANNDILYQLLGTRVHVATIPPNVRDYSNVTLHVALKLLEASERLFQMTLSTCGFRASQSVFQRRLHPGALCSCVSISTLRRSQRRSEPTASSSTWDTGAR